MPFVKNPNKKILNSRRDIFSIEEQSHLWCKQLGFIIIKFSWKNRYLKNFNREVLDNQGLYYMNIDGIVSENFIIGKIIISNKTILVSSIRESIRIVKKLSKNPIILQGQDLNNLLQKW